MTKTRKSPTTSKTPRGQDSDGGSPFVYSLELTKKIDLVIDDFDSRQSWMDVDVRILASHENGDEPSQVGSVQVQLIHTDDGRELLDALVNLQLEDLYLELFIPRTITLRPAIAKVYGRTVLTDPLLYVQEMWIDRDHRGREIGVRVMEALLAEFSPSITLAFCIPWPLNKTNPAGEKPRGRTLDDGKSRLIRHWKKAGFRKLGRGPYWYVKLR